MPLGKRDVNSNAQLPFIIMEQWPKYLPTIHVHG